MKPYQRQKHLLLQYVSCFLFLLLNVAIAQAQVTIFPKNNQLYPRDLSTNKATIKVAGLIQESSGYSQLRLKRYRSGKLQKITYWNLVYVNGVANYELYNEITAELQNYSFSLYGYNGAEKLIQSASNVVAGDAYIIQGQSNAVANQRGGSSSSNDADSYTNAPYRNWVRVFGNGSASGNYTHGWFIGRGNVWYDTDGHTGQWGMRMASNLAGAKKVPIAIFNGASPGNAIAYFKRNDANPGDPLTNYGRLLNRITEAGLAKHIRGVIWHQGESDVLGVLSNIQKTTEQYKEAFIDLYNDWKSDYPGLNRCFIFQIRFGCGMSSPENCVRIQEAQRQLDKESGEILTLGTSNTQQLFDGGSINYCHYTYTGGYKAMGDWITRVIRRDIYQESNWAVSIESPEPEHAAFTLIDANGVASQLSLTLKSQSSTNTLSGDITSQFKLEGGSFTINSVSLNSNTLTISFKRNEGTLSNPVGITYMGHDNTAAPQLTNSNGMGLVYFENFPISGIVPPPPPPPPAEDCPDSYEPNNTLGTASSIGMNTTYSASVSSSSDEDWYRFRTWAPWRYLKISIWGMTADYDLFLYDANGNLLTSSENSGSSEALIYNDGPDDFSYRLKIVGKNGANDPSACYSLRLQASSGAWPADSPPYAGTSQRQASPMEEIALTPAPRPGLRVYPNPAIHHLMVDFASHQNEVVEFRVYDLAGRQLFVHQTKAAAGSNRQMIPVSGLATGAYFLQLRSTSGNVVTRFVVGSK